MIEKYRRELMEFNKRNPRKKTNPKPASAPNPENPQKAFPPEPALKIVPTPSLEPVPEPALPPPEPLPEPITAPVPEPVLPPPEPLPEPIIVPVPEPVLPPPEPLPEPIIVPVPEPVLPPPEPLPEPIIVPMPEPVLPPPEPLPPALLSLPTNPPPMPDSLPLITSSPYINTCRQGNCKSMSDFLSYCDKTGILRVGAHAASEAFPVQSARVTVSKTIDGGTKVFYTERTDANGVAYGMTLPAPDKSLAAYPSAHMPFASYDVTVEHPKYVTMKHKNCAVFDGLETVQSFELIPRIPGLDRPEPVVRDEPEPDFGRYVGDGEVKAASGGDMLSLDGDDADTLRRQLNRVSANYPAIPRTAADDSSGGGLDDAAKKSVAAFQQIFSLPVSGGVDEATRDKLNRVYDSVSELSRLYSEGITIDELERLFSGELKRGSKGKPVQIMQYFLSFIGHFNRDVPIIAADGIFGVDTETAVRAFQRAYGLREDGIAGRKTWDMILRAYSSVLDALPSEYLSYSSLYYPGYFIQKGASGKVVEQLQSFLRTIARHNSGIPMAETDGSYGVKTESAVSAVQRLAGIPVTGEVGPMTWNAIINMYNEYR